MARKKTNITQNERRERYKQGWRDLGIHESIISRLDLRNKNPETAKKLKTEIFQQAKTQSRVTKTKETKARNAEIRKQHLISKGYKAKDIKPIWLTSDTKMYEQLGTINPNKVFKANKFLALAFTNVNGASAIMNTSAYKHLSFDELKEKIQQRIADSESDPDGSDSLTCVFQMFHGSEEECEEQLTGFAKRGYNLSIKKLTDRRYYKLVNRNDWTMREYAEMMCCVLEQCHNKDVPMLVDQFRYFVDDTGLPFDEIFN